MTIRVTVPADYGAHRSATTWLHELDLFCPSCGAKELWRDELGYDYESGDSFICSACGATFSMHGPREPETGHAPIIAELRRCLGTGGTIDVRPVPPRKMLGSVESAHKIDPVVYVKLAVTPPNISSPLLRFEVDQSVHVHVDGKLRTIRASNLSDTMKLAACCVVSQQQHEYDPEAWRKL